MKKRIIEKPKNIYFEFPVKQKVNLSFKENQSAILEVQSIKRKFFIILIPIIGFGNYFSPLLNNKFLPEYKKNLNVFSFDYFFDNIFFVVLMIFPFFFYYLLRKQIINGTAMKGIDYIFDKDILTISTETMKTEISLNSIEKVLITNNLIMIYLNKYSANIIPKRIFKNEKEMNEFISQFEK